MAENRFAQFAQPAQTSSNRFAQFAEKQEPTAREYALGGVGGFNQGLASMINAPGNLMDMAGRGVGLLGEGERYFGGDLGERIVGGIGAAGSALVGEEAPDMFYSGPDDELGRFVNRVGQEVGASAIPAGITLRAARGLPAASAIPQSATQAFLDPIRRTPGRAALGETAAATGAGVGAGIAQEAFPGNATAEMLGQLGGGMFPAVLANTPTALATRGASAVTRRLSSDAQRQAARDVVQDFMGDQMTTQAREALDSSGQIMREIPGFEPSLAERTGSPGLVRKQQDLETQAAGSDLDAAVARRVANEEAVQRFADGAAPIGEGPQMVVDVARRRVDDLRGGIGDQAGSVDAGRRNLADSLPVADAGAEGARVRKMLQDRVGDEHVAFQIFAREAGLDDPNFIVPFTGFRDDIMNAYNQATRLKMQPGAEGMQAPPQMVARIQSAAEAQNFPALMELRSDISGAIRRAERMPSVDDTYLRGLRAMKSAFDTSLERAVQQTGDPDIARRYAEFRQRYLTDFVEPYRQRASHDILHKDATGAYATPDERVVREYFAPGKTTNAQQFKAVFGNDATANAALEAVALDSLRRTAVRDGVIDPRAFQTWIRAHQSVLAEFPDIARRVSEVGAANQALLQRQRALTQRSRAVEDSILSRELRAVELDARTPQEAVGRALESPRKMAQLRGRLRGNPEAEAALRRAVWDQVADRQAGDLADFINRNASSLKVAGLTQEHLNALKTIDAARTMMARVPHPRGSADIPTSADAFVRTFGVRPEMLANRLREIHTGRSEKTWVISNLMTNILARKQGQYVDEAFKTLLYDREVAEGIANSIRRGGMPPEVAKRLHARFFALGLAPMDPDGGEEQ